MVFRFHFGFGIMHTSNELYSHSLQCKPHGCKLLHQQFPLDISYWCLFKGNMSPFYVPVFYRFCAGTGNFLSLSLGEWWFSCAFPLRLYSCVFRLLVSSYRYFPKEKLYVSSIQPNSSQSKSETLLMTKCAAHRHGYCSACNATRLKYSCARMPEVT